MRRVASLLVVLCALAVTPGCTLWGEKKVVNRWSEVTGGESLERSFWRDIKARDDKGLSKHMAGNYIAQTPAGVLNRDQALAKLQGLKLQGYSLSDVQVELNASTLVVTYTVVLQGTYDGQPLPATPARIMGVWQQQKAGWMAIAHSVQRGWSVGN